MEKLILEALSYVEKLGQPYLLYLVLFVALLHVGSKLLVQLTEAFIKAFPRRQPINLDAYDVDRKDMTGNNLIGYNHMQAFKNAWGINLERDKRERLIALHVRLGGTYDFSFLIAAKDYMDFSEDPIRIKISIFEHFEGYFFKTFSVILMALSLAVLVSIGLLSTIDADFLSGNGILKLLTMVILFAIGARFFNWAQSDYAKAKRLRKTMKELP